MTITQLIEKLQKLQTNNPDCEVRFEVREVNSVEYPPKPLSAGLDTVTLGHDSFGQGCIFRLITDVFPK